MRDFNILIVEDEALVALEIKANIESLGFFVVDYATSSRMAREIIEKSRIDLIIIDINLKESRDGIDFYNELEQKIPVIYITAYRDNATISKAVLTNPYGYLIKPYKIEELNALLQIVFFKVSKKRSLSCISNDIYRLDDDYCFDLKGDKLFFRGLEIHLTPKETSLLKLLIEYDGQPIDFKSIENMIWKNEIVTNGSVRTLIYRLRGKLNGNLIEKIFGYGVRLKANVSR